MIYFLDILCRNCSAPNKKEPNKEYFGLMLHCWRYKSDEWSFEAPLPEWIPKDTEMPLNSKIVNNTTPISEQNF